MIAASLFFLAARLKLSEPTIQRVIDRMKAIGAKFEFEERI